MKEKKDVKQLKMENYSTPVVKTINLSESNIASLSCWQCDCSAR